MPERFELDLHNLDLRTLTSDQRGAVFEIARARARRERAIALRSFFRAIRRRFRGWRVFPPILRNIRLPLGASLGRS